MRILQSIEPEEVLDKPAFDMDGAPVGRVVDVGLFSHARVKFLVVEDADDQRVLIRRYGIDDIHGVGPESVTLRIDTNA